MGAAAEQTSFGSLTLRLGDRQSHLAMGMAALGLGREVQGAQLAAGPVARTSHSPLALPWLSVGFHNVLFSSFPAFKQTNKRPSSFPAAVASLSYKSSCNYF